MKNTYLILMLLFITSCTHNVETYDSINKSDKSFSEQSVEQVNDNVTAKQIFREDKQPPLIIHIINYDGHEYILARKNEAGGLTHSESCTNDQHKISDSKYDY